MTEVDMAEIARADSHAAAVTTIKFNQNLREHFFCVSTYCKRVEGRILMQ